MKLTLLSLLVAASSSSFWSRPVFATQAEFDIWNAITPSALLNWTSCYTAPLECARLLVPLDYSQPNGTQAAIALIRRPALVPSNSSEYRGPVLVNPGGPGQSGVTLVKNSNGPLLSTILGPEFDLVGFDPRGVGRSTPRANFFETQTERDLFTGTDLPVLHNDTLAQQIIAPRAASILLNILAEARDDGSLKHLNTPNAATDMLSIVQAHGREKLQYWGFSYGTVLGVTFASLYPDKIERLVLDGVVDSEDWYGLPNVPTNPADTGKALDAFFQTCADAGPDSCAFWESNPEDISQRLNALSLKLSTEPIPVKVNEAYGVVDEAFLRQTMFTNLYGPLNNGYINLAIALKQLEDGDASGILVLTASPPPQCSCDPQVDTFDSVFDSQIAIVCNDGAAVSSSSDAIEKYLKGFSEINPYPELWGSFYFECLGWPISHKGSFDGPFVGNTSFPLLFIGNVADPAASLSGAKKMAKGFKGAVVLTQNSTAHCSLNYPSTCTQRSIQQYFQNGTLPAPNTICQPINPNPFLPPPGGSQDLASDEDVAFQTAVLGMSGILKPFLMRSRKF